METAINSENTVFTNTMAVEEIDRLQILRYAGMAGRTDDEATLALIDKCYPLMLNALKFKSCYLETEVKITGTHVSLGCMEVESKNLSAVLRGCEKAILVAATAGIEADMLVKRAEVTSKAEALILNSVAIAGIEKYMGMLNEYFKGMYSGYELRPRYSPGYGDVPLELQRELLAVLDTKRKIGVALSDSLLMTPTKSVSAVIGVGSEGCMHIDKDCDICSKKDCEYRLS